MQEYEHHALQAVRLAQHLRSLNATVIWVDYNPTSFGAHGKPILQCLLHVNGVGHAQVLLHTPPPPPPPPPQASCCVMKKAGWPVSVLSASNVVTWCCILTSTLSSSLPS